MSVKEDFIVELEDKIQFMKDNLSDCEYLERLFKTAVRWSKSNDKLAAEAGDYGKVALRIFDLDNIDELEASDINDIETKMDAIYQG